MANEGTKKAPETEQRPTHDDPRHEDKKKQQPGGHNGKVVRLYEDEGGFDGRILLCPVRGFGRGTPAMRRT